MGLNKWKGTFHSLQCSPGRAGSARESHPQALPFILLGGFGHNPSLLHPDTHLFRKGHEAPSRCLAHTRKGHHELLLVITPLGGIGTPPTHPGLERTSNELHPRQRGSSVAGSQPALNLGHLGATYSTRDQLCTLKPP